MRETRINGEPDRRRPFVADRHAWALNQIKVLRQNHLDDLSVSRLAAEITELGRREYSALLSAMTRLLRHLLKWDHQPERRGRSWANTIDEQRERIRDRLADNPSLVRQIDEMLGSAYRRGRAAMVRETSLSPDVVPEACPYSWKEIMTREIAWPGDELAR